MSAQDEFYVMLPSNSSMDEFPKNTLQRFSTLLSETIELSKGSYEVALAEFHYPTNFVLEKTLKVSAAENFHLIYYDLDAKKGVTETNRARHEIGSNTETTDYFSMDAIALDINAESQDRFIPHLNDTPDDAPFLKYDEVMRQYDLYNYLSTDGTKAVELVLDPRLARQFGFAKTSFPHPNQTKKRKRSVIPHTVKADIPVEQVPLTSITSLYVYTDIIVPTIVGDVKAPLLRIVNVNRKRASNVGISFNRLQYHPVLKQSLRTITIDIRTDTGEPAAFSDNGRVVAVLHFRRAS